MPDYSGKGKNSKAELDKESMGGEEPAGKKVAPRTNPSVANPKKDGSSDESPDPKKAEEAKAGMEKRMKDLTAKRKGQFIKDPNKDEE
jgi:hypothetical protein